MLGQLPAVLEQIVLGILCTAHSTAVSVYKHRRDKRHELRVGPDPNLTPRLHVQGKVRVRLG